MNIVLHYYVGLYNEERNQFKHTYIHENFGLSRSINQIDQKPSNYLSDWQTLLSSQ